MSRSTSDLSVVYWCSSSSKHKCGYCKNEEGSISHGMWAKILSVQDYQSLIDRGWRRSGSYCYKPIMDQICCPQYTIRCDALNFQLSKSQKKVIKKFNKFINDGELNRTDTNSYSENLENVSETFMFREKPPDNFDKNLDDFAVNLDYDLDQEIAGSSENKKGQQPQQQQQQQQQQTRVVLDEEKAGCSQNNKLQTPKNGTGADPNKPPKKKAKLLRLERKQEKMLKRGMSLEKLPQNNQSKSLEEFLGEIAPNSKHKFKLELINISQRDENWERVKHIEFDLYKRYQMTIHNDPKEKCTMDGFCRFLVHSPLKITLEQINVKHKHFNLVAELFAKYQIAIHNDSPDECDKEQFVDFLIDTELQYKQFSDNPKMGFGSFHQLYWLDNKLIAVGVIDILPKCVSAVYFFYDPDYRNLTLGTYGSLREVEFVRSLHQKIPSIEYYYMGFYIHSCPKMRYKGRLCPSFLLCPETYNWVPIERCIPKLDVEKYCRLVDDLDAIDENACNSREIDQIKVFVNKIMPFQKYKQKYGEQEIFDLIGMMVGKKCISTMVFIPG